MIYVTGANGRLGSALCSIYGYEPLLFNVSSSREAEKALYRLSPKDTLVHCAAITNVDACDSTLIKEARLVNGLGTLIVREWFPGRVIYISTDFVFDGKFGPYSEKAPTCPINNYGMSKLMGEEAINKRDKHHDLIIRTTMLYGGNKTDFPVWVSSMLSKGEPFEVYMNEYTTPTYVPHLAEAINHILKKGYPPNTRMPPKIINIVGREWISKYEFALMIANVTGQNPALIKPARSSRNVAVRPLKAGLKVDLADKLKIPIHSVLEGLKEYEYA